MNQLVANDHCRLAFAEVGHEVLWGGGPSDPELIPYAWSLIKARGGGLEKFSLTAVTHGPHDLPCPW